MPAGLDPDIFKAVVSTIVPEATAFDRQAWDDLEQIVEALLRGRPEALKRQLRMFLRGIEWLPVLRFGRRFTRLSLAGRTQFLRQLQNNRVQKIRVGFWGLRTIVLAGYYGRPQAAQAIGYAARREGWEALR